MSLLGKVVTVEGRQGKFVVLGLKQHDDYGSLSYDREFRLIPLEEMVGKSEISMQAGETFWLRGTRFTIHVLEDEAPFELQPTCMYNIRRMQPSVKITYV